MIDIEPYLNHKITKNNHFCGAEENSKYGIIDMVIEDEKFDFEKKVITVDGIHYLIYGIKSDKDNFTSLGQKIKIDTLEMIDRIELIGFNEFGNYIDNIELVDECNKHIKKKIQFYPIMENVDSMYEWEMSANCSVFLQTIIGGFMQANIYRYEIEVFQKVSEIIFPKSEELHIFAISLVLRDDRDEEKKC